MSKLVPFTQELQGALRDRGFFVRALHNRLVLEAGSWDTEMRDLEMLLAEVGVAVHCGGSSNSVSIRSVNGVSQDVLQTIRLFPARRCVQEPSGYDSSWKSFTRRRHGHKSNALSYDPGVSYLVRCLSKAGVLVHFGFDGRGRRHPYIEFAGAWNAAWFEILFDDWLESKELHYRWSLVTQENGRTMLRAFRKDDRPAWNQQHIQEDTVRMGTWCNEHADAIRSLKLASYKYKRMKKTAECKAGDYYTLKQWMGEQISMIAGN